MAEIIHVSQLIEPPKLRRRYLVPCVLAPRNGDQREFWVPVIGPRHDDPEIGVRWQHFHHDWRFVTRRLFREYFRIEPDQPDAADRPFAKIAHSKVVSTITRGPEDRVMVCVREMLEFPRVTSFMHRLEPRHADQLVKPGCAVCPHRGMPLENLPRDASGCVVCPGHGLKWNLTTGQLVSRRAAEVQP